MLQSCFFHDSLNFLNVSKAMAFQCSCQSWEVEKFARWQIWIVCLMKQYTCLQVLTKRLWWITLYAATHCLVGWTIFLLPEIQGDDGERCPVNVAVHLCRRLSLQFGRMEKKHLLHYTSAVKEGHQHYICSIRGRWVCASQLYALSL
jgi:hypothetical protein